MRKGESTYNRVIQVKITESQYQFLMRLCGASGTVSKVLRMLIDEALKARGL